MLTVLGVDPGATNFGWAQITLEDNVVSLGLCGLIQTPREDTPYNVYLNDIVAQITEQFPVILSLVQPQVIYSEYVPPGRLGSRSELVTAASSVAKTIAFQWGIEWHGIAASSWKKIVLDDSTATKARIRNHMLDCFPSLADRHKQQKEEQKSKGEKAIGVPQDVFDALGVAIAGCKQYESNQLRRQAPDH
jgi:Holliday junction resolvasome RuvABC endonuclease subunit